MRPYTGTPSNLCVYVCVGVCVKTERPMINSMCVSLRARVCVSVCVLSARVPACVCVSVCVVFGCPLVLTQRMLEASGVDSSALEMTLSCSFEMY